MKYSILAAALAAAPAIAAPAKRADPPLDVTVLQFALTLEHLEAAFYSEGLRRQPLVRSKFFDAGYDQFYYDNLKRITDDEKAHVDLLRTAIKNAGYDPVVPCKYNFESAFSSVQNFVTTSSILEGVGTSAYLGGAPLITSKDYLTVAGSILVTESLHTSYQRNAIKEVPFATPYGTPLDPTSVYTLASMFITSCPDRNGNPPKVPFTPYPTLSVTSSSATPVVAGTTVTFTSAADVPDTSYLTFVSGLSVISVQATKNGKTVSAAVPVGVAGQSYVILSSNSVTKLADLKVVSGPAILEVTPGPPKSLN